MKKSISLLLIISMLLINAIPVNAQSTQCEEDVIVSDKTSVSIMDSSAMNVYLHYLPVFADKNNPSSADILASGLLVPLKDSEVPGVALYKLEHADSVLPECKTIIEISTLNDVLYFQYLTFNNLEVIAGYTSDGLYEFGIYDNITDTCLYLQGDNCVEYKNARYGITVVAKDAVNDSLFSVSSDRSTAAIKNNKEVLKQELESVYPPQYDSPVTYSRYCAALGANRNVKVYSNRTNYMFYSGSRNDFAVSTTVSVIALTYGASISVTTVLLTTIGVAISALNEILEAVTLYNTANFRYTDIRQGTVMDTTVYNSYVLVINQSATGMYTRVKINTGEWVWGESSPSSLYYSSKSATADNAMSNYNWDVAVNGACTLYTPAGF